VFENQDYLSTLSQPKDFSASGSGVLRFVSHSRRGFSPADQDPYETENRLNGFTFPPHTWSPG
jgi:hypothetical protein